MYFTLSSQPASTLHLSPACKTQLVLLYYRAFLVYKLFFKAINSFYILCKKASHIVFSVTLEQVDLIYQIEMCKVELLHSE